MPRDPSTPRRPPPPLNAEALDRLALRYVERFATTRGRLAAYLTRKLRERGWDDGASDGGAPDGTLPGPDPAAVAERMAALGYVDDRAFAEARAAAMTRRGLGARRIAMTFRQDGVGAEDAGALSEQIDARATEAALAFARRRRIGPYAAAPGDRPLRKKQMAAMLRAGHAPALARRIVALAPGDALVDE